MKKRLTIGSLLIVAFWLLSRKKKYQTAKSGKSLLWEISGNGLSFSSYILGTMHLVCSEDARLSKPLIQIIKSVKQVYLETDLNHAADQLMKVIQLNAQLGNTLANVLSEKEYETVKDFFSTYQPEVPFTIIENQPPLLISSGLYELMLPCEEKEGVDLKIFELAAKYQKKTLGLETIEYQANLLQSIPYAEQAAEMVKMIESLEKNKVVLYEMIDCYKSQDVEKLYTLAINDEGIAGNNLDLLLHQRNFNWIDQINNILIKGPSLFAVGAGHLGGENGLLNLLRKKGFSVRPLKN